jgi:hypothetical protein
MGVLAAEEAGTHCGDRGGQHAREQRESVAQLADREEQAGEGERVPHIAGYHGHLSRPPEAGGILALVAQISDAGGG